VSQALIMLFGAAPAAVKGLLHMKETGDVVTVEAKGWGS
jgi:hypothetical protein